MEQTEVMARIVDTILFFSIGAEYEEHSKFLPRHNVVDTASPRSGHLRRGRKQSTVLDR